MAAKKAIGTVLKVGDGASPEVFTAIAGLSSITGPEFQAAEIDVTSMDTTGGFTERITGLKSPGNISATLYFDASLAQHQAILDDFNAGTQKNYRLELATFSPAKYFSFAGTVQQLSYSFSTDGAQQANFQLQIAGNVTDNF
jgi:predicted secreted protein